ncbi:MAG: glycosyltransferase family 4 protein [Rhodothermia bacterium]|nr:glycosyltransferase family 4 protein [Rhodothermia bacterium]
MPLTVRCLPVGGRENPYQYLMMKGLRNEDMEVGFGADGKWLAILRTVLRYWPDTVHFDWIYRYFLRRRRWWTWLNAPVFVLEVLFVRFVLRRRLVWTMHNLGTHDIADSFIERAVRRTFARCCDWIRVFDQSTVQRAADYLNVSTSRFLIIPEGSYADYYTNQISKGEARRSLGISGSGLVLSFVGGIHPYKGVRDLVETFVEIGDEDWRLLIAGNPSDSDYAEDLLKQARMDDRIVCRFEFIHDEDLQIFFNASDVVVLPFREIENSGSVILAMSFKKAVVAPSIGVVGSRLQHQAELLYKPGELAQGLIALKDVSISFLEGVGESNYDRVSQSRWEDFRKAFER